MFRKTFLSSLLALTLVGACVAGALAQGDKKMPARDPKTGKFMKAGAGKLAPAVEKQTSAPVSGAKITPKMAIQSMKKMPARDPKTGKFVKKMAPADAKAAPKK